MFKIECTIEDRDLAGVLRVIAGVVHDLQINAVGEGEPKPEAKRPYKRRVIDRPPFDDVFAPLPATFVLSDVQKALKERNLAHSRANTLKHYLVPARKAKLIRMSRVGIYEKM